MKPLITSLRALAKRGNEEAREEKKTKYLWKCRKECAKQLGLTFLDLGAPLSQPVTARLGC